MSVYAIEGCTTVTKRQNHFPTQISKFTVLLVLDLRNYWNKVDTISSSSAGTLETSLHMVHPRGSQTDQCRARAARWLRHIVPFSGQREQMSKRLTFAVLSPQYVSFVRGRVSELDLQHWVTVAVLSTYTVLSAFRNANRQSAMCRAT